MENKKETWKLRQIVAKKLRLPQRGQRCGGREELPCELLQPVDSKLFSFFQSLEQKNFAFGFNVQGWECSPCTQPCWHRGWRWLPTCSCCWCRPSPTERIQVSFTQSTNMRQNLPWAGRSSPARRGPCTWRRSPGRSCCWCCAQPETWSRMWWDCDGRIVARTFWTPLPCQVSALSLSSRAS